MVVIKVIIDIKSHYCPVCQAIASVLLCRLVFKDLCRAVPKHTNELYIHICIDCVLFTAHIRFSVNNMKVLCTICPENLINVMGGHCSAIMNKKKHNSGWEENKNTGFEGGGHSQTARLREGDQFCFEIS